MFKTTKEKKKISDISMKIPGIQHDLNYTAVLEIVKYEKSHYERFGCYALPGVISIAIDENNFEHLIDGNHRIQAYTSLFAEFSERDLIVDLNLYWCKNSTDIDIIYKIVNTCTPNPITKLSISDYKIIQSIKNVPTEKSYYFYCVKDSGEKLGPSFFLLW